MLKREESRSLYALGYSDGYNGVPFRSSLHSMKKDSLEKLDVDLEIDLREYREGYDTGKFNFFIDRKHGGFV